MEELKISTLFENGRFFRTHVKDQNELYEFLAEELGKEGFIKDTFLEALKKRESVYPTGIIAQPYNIGLPHVDSEHVLTNALVVTILDEPIMWHRMDNVTEEIPVQLVFMILIETLELHVKAISSLVGIWQNQDFMNALPNVQSKEELLELLDKINA